jgi:DNA mismatch repair ATPase MutS
VAKFYQNYKDIERSIQRQEDQKEAPTALLKQIEKAQLIPKTFKLVQHKGSEEELNLQSYGMFEGKYAKAIANAIELSQLKKVNVAENYLREPATSLIVKAINKSVKEIDLSTN